MTKEERVILMNQYILMKKIGVPGFYDEQDLDNKIEILSHGWTYLYDDEILDVQEECDESIQIEVINILDMYRTITNSVEDLSQEEIDSIPHKHLLEFQGFDGNEESYHYSFMRFFIEKMGRFDELKSINSHRNILSQYRSMLMKYNETFNKKRMGPYTLTIDELKYILE